MDNEELKKFEQASNLNQLNNNFGPFFCGEFVEGNTYRIEAKFAIGETVKRVKQPYNGVLYMNITSIEPRITKNDIQVYYKCNNGWELYHESQLQKVED